MEGLFEEDSSFGWPDCVFEERAALRSDCSLSVKKRPGTDVAVEEVLMEETLQLKLERQWKSVCLKALGIGRSGLNSPAVHNSFSRQVPSAIKQ